MAILAQGVMGTPTAAVAMAMAMGANSSSRRCCAATCGSRSSLSTKLTGFSDDATYLLVGLAEGLDVRGIVLAGVVIGSLGVLDDVVVTQVSSVWELKRADPTLGTMELFTPAMRIGRDHISSTVNTLFLAYAGAALPLLLLFTESAQSLSSVVTREVVATEVVRALVGSIGLVASVPISTWLAATVLTR